MDKQHIIREIIRTAKENNGIPLGRAKFKTETGIKESDWVGKHWARWGDAVKEAGLTPNKLRSAYDEEWLIEKFISLIKEIKKFPSPQDLRLKAHNTVNFPADSTFDRLGTTSQRANTILNYCEGKSEYSDVVEICRNYIASFKQKSNVEFKKETEDNFGYVYLQKFGTHYKIGKSINVERRNYEIGIKLPEALEIIHKIRTDDPSGIEAYWHHRFKDKRKQGEWFALTSNDIQAFKRRKFM